MADCQINILDIPVVTTQPGSGELVMFTDSTGLTVFRTWATIKAWINGGVPQSLPTANAGTDKTIISPSNIVFLNGVGQSTGGTIVSYLWEKLSGPSGGTIISSGLANTTVTGLSTGVYEFRLTVQDNIGQTASDTVQVTRVAASIALAIAQQPIDLTIDAGASAQFAVIATGGTAPYTYSWRKDGIVMGITTSTLTIPNVQEAANEGSYDVVVTDSLANSVISNAAVLTVNVPVIVPPSFTLQPVSSYLNEGDTLSLSVAVTGTAPFTYQWRKNGVNISGATSPTFVQSNVQEADEAIYTCVVSNGAGAVTSSAAIITINESSETTHQVNYGWTTSEVTAANVDDLPLGNSATVNNNAESFTVDFRAASGPYYFVISEPAAQPVKTSFVNTAGFNQGTIPGFEFEDPIIIGSTRYYFSRGAIVFDSSSTTTFYS